MWRATFDWIIRQDKFVAIWEGYYARREGGELLGTTIGHICSNNISCDSIQHMHTLSTATSGSCSQSVEVDKWGPKPKKRFNRMLTHNWNYTMLEQME